MKQNVERKFASHFETFFEKTQEIICVMSATKPELDDFVNKCRTKELCFHLENGGQYIFYLDASYTDNSNNLIQESVVFIRNINSSAQIESLLNFYNSCLYAFDQPWCLIRFPKREFEYFSFSDNNLPEHLNKDIENVNDLIELFKSVKGNDYQLDNMIKKTCLKEYIKRSESEMYRCIFSYDEDELSKDSISVTYNHILNRIKENTKRSKRSYFEALKTVIKKDQVSIL